MRDYAIAAAVGLAVGVLYGALNVRSPAPPVVALIGLLAMLGGEQLVPVFRRLVTGGSLIASRTAELTPQVSGPTAMSCHSGDPHG